jgi:anthranilate phosphoribosyltransferase
MRAVFTGQDRGSHRDALVLNAALALEVTGTVADPHAAIRAASDALDRGDGARLLEKLATFGRSIGGVP